MSLRTRIAALLGISAFALPTSSLPSLDDESVERTREAYGGQISPMPVTRTRWHLSDLEYAQRAADVGDLSHAAQLCASMRRDGTLHGVLSTRANGIVHLPKRFRGNDRIVRALEGRDGARSVFDAMLPPSELAAMATDEIQLGVSVGELVPVKGRSYPVLVRLDPFFLRYRWSENRWYYQSIAGALPITPGDGRWVLHIGGGRLAPWQSGLWHALGRAYINKEHALLHSANWEAKLANPARVAIMPQGSSEEQKQSWFRKVMAWGVNTVFGLTPGYDVKLLESNGRGYESFGETIERSNVEFMIAVAGQVVTVTGGTGFANADVHKSIRADLIKTTADRLAFTISTQAIPPYVEANFGEEFLEESPSVEWDTTPPGDLKADADAIAGAARAIQEMNAALTQYGVRVDALAVATKFGVPVQALESKIEAPSVALAPTDVVKIVKVNEARAATGLGPLTDENGSPSPFGDLIISEFVAMLEARSEPSEGARIGVEPSNDREAA